VQIDAWMWGSVKVEPLTANSSVFVREEYSRTSMWPPLEAVRLYRRFEIRERDQAEPRKRLLTPSPHVQTEKRPVGRHEIGLI